MAEETLDEETLKFVNDFLYEWSIGFKDGECIECLADQAKRIYERATGSACPYEGEPDEWDADDDEEADPC